MEMKIKKLKTMVSIDQFTRRVSEMQAALIECRHLLEVINREAAQDPKNDRDTEICKQRLRILETRVVSTLDRFEQTITQMKQETPLRARRSK